MSMGRDMQVDYCNRFTNSKLCHNDRVKLLLPHLYIDSESIRIKMEAEEKMRSQKIDF